MIVGWLFCAETWSFDHTWKNQFIARSETVQRFVSHQIVTQNKNRSEWLMLTALQSLSFGREVDIWKYSVKVKAERMSLVHHRYVHRGSKVTSNYFLWDVRLVCSGSVTFTQNTPVTASIPQPGLHQQELHEMSLDNIWVLLIQLHVLLYFVSFG